MTGHAVLTPLLMALIMIVGDALGMSLATDNVRPSAHPNRWRVGRLTAAGVFIGTGQLSTRFRPTKACRAARATNSR
jgi:H+-transporting ATPase